MKTRNSVKMYNKILQIKTSTFPRVPQKARVQFSESNMFIKIHYYLIFLVKFNYLNQIKNDFFEMVFDFITFSIVM